jgi:hypothetical protein
MWDFGDDDALKDFVGGCAQVTAGCLALGAASHSSNTMARRSWNACCMTLTRSTMCSI